MRGQFVMSLRRQLRSALPKKKSEASTTVVVHVTEGLATFRLAGASVSLMAEAAVPFVVEMPWLQFKAVVVERFRADEPVVFEFEPGSFALQGVRSQARSIVVRDPAGVPVVGASAEVRRAPPYEPGDGFVGLPLVVAYRHLRRHGMQPTMANREFLRQVVEVDALLEAAAKTLKPLGLTRADVEAAIDRKVGGG